MKPFVTVVNHWQSIPDNLGCEIVWYKLPEGIALHYGETLDLKWYLFNYWMLGWGEKARENGIQILAIPIKISSTVN